MPIYVIRHAHAGSRHKWDGPDALRPLTTKGRARADEIGHQLAGVGITRALSSPLLRCVETVEPLAARVGLEVERSEALREGARLADTIDLVEGLAIADETVALCSHGDVIPDLLAGLARRGADLDPDGSCAKGSIWVLHVEAGVVRTADHLGG